MVNYVELFSLALITSTAFSKSDNVFLGLNIQDNETTEAVDDTVLSAIESDPLNIELVLYNSDLFPSSKERFKVSECHIKHFSNSEQNFLFIVQQFIKYAVTICSNHKFEIMKKRLKKNGSKKAMRLLRNNLHQKVLGTNCALKLFYLDYNFNTSDHSLVISFKIDIPENGFMSFSPDMVAYLEGQNAEYGYMYNQHDLSAISIRKLLDERLEAYTIAQDAITDPLTDAQKEQLYPLVLYPFQEKTVSWMLQREMGRPDLLTYEVVRSNILKYLDEIQLGYVSILDGAYFYNTITKYSMSKEKAIAFVLNNSVYYNESIERGNIKSGYGVLCEDMSLGKTVECISTIILNKFDTSQITKYNDWRLSLLNENEEARSLISSTLVVCTDTILDQWVSSFSEFSESLDYKIYHYKGFKEFQKEFTDISPQEFARQLGIYDIIITSYSTLVREVSFVDFADRKMANNAKTRNSKCLKYDYSSPLCLVTFARAIFDEAQSLSPASLSSINRIKKIHTWAVSATPLKFNDFEKCLGELKNLFSSLSFVPFNDSNFRKISINNIMEWKLKPIYPTTSDYSSFYASPIYLVESLLDSLISRDIFRRHSRDSVQNQLNIPKQHKYLVPVYLTPIEREMYSQCYRKCLDECRLGRYVITDISRLNMYLTNLTTICIEGLHVGNVSPYSSWQNQNEGKNDDIDFSTKPNSMETILANMILDNDRSLNSLKRTLITNYVDNARYILERVKDFETSEKLLRTAEKLVNNELEIHNVDETTYENNNETSFKTTLLILSHGIHFFLGNCYFQLGEQCTNTVEGESYAIRENHEYELADKIRRLVLKSHIDEVNDIMAILKDEKILEHPELPLYGILDLKSIEQSFYDKIETLYSDSLDSNDYLNSDIDESDSILSDQEFDSLKRKRNQKQKNINTYENKIKPLLADTADIINLLNKQWNLVTRLYAENIELLKIPILVDKEEKETKKFDIVDVKKEEETSVTEYETGLDIQNKIFYNFELINLILENRKFLLEDNSSGKGNKKFVISEDFHEYKDEYFVIDSKHCWFAIYRVFLNLKIVQQTPILKIFNKVIDQINFSDDHKAYAKWQKRIQELNKIFNKKIAYYKSLQIISDKVMDLNFAFEAETFEKLNSDFELILAENNRQLKKLISRKKFLEGLSSIQKGEEMKCLICLDVIKQGSILECGHKFCRDCIRQWFSKKKVCALCNRKVSLNEIHDFYIDLRPSDHCKNTLDSKYGNEKSSIKRETELLTLNGYTVFFDMNKVEQFYIQNLNYGAKVDILLKFLSYIDMKDDTDASSLGRQQIVIYSRFVNVIPLLAKILTDCGFKTLAAIDPKTKGSVIADFKKQRENRILILTTDANAGLTLVNASILVLFDPILQNSVEEQTINRISRIGQKRETMVLNFITMNTVEENIIRYKEALKNKDFITQMSVGDAAGTVTKLKGQPSRKRKSEEMVAGKKLHQMMLSSSFLEKCLFFNEEDTG